MTECSACGAELGPHEIRCPTCGKVTAQYHRQRRCIHCGTPAAGQAKTCMMCHRPVDHRSLRGATSSGAWLAVALGALVVVGAVVGVNRYQRAGQPAMVQASAASPTATVTFTPTTTGTPTPLPPTETPTATPTPTVTPRVHVIDSGETLLYVSQLYGVPLNVLTAFNAMDEAEMLDIGQEILIPPLPGGVQSVPDDAAAPEIVYVIQAGDTLSGIAFEQGTSVDAIRRANSGQDLELIFPGQRIIVPLFTPTPTGTPTPSPTETPTPGPEYPAPYLLTPADGAVIETTTLLLNWTSPRILGATEYFVVQLAWPNDQVTEHWVKNNSFRMSAAERPANGQVSWAVTIRRKTESPSPGEPSGVILSPPGQTRLFEWR